MVPRGVVYTVLSPHLCQPMPTLMNLNGVLCWVPTQKIFLPPCPTKLLFPSITFLYFVGPTGVCPTLVLAEDSPLSPAGLKMPSEIEGLPEKLLTTPRIAADFLGGHCLFDQQPSQLFPDRFQFACWNLDFS